MTSTIADLTNRIAQEIGTVVFGHTENTRLLIGSFLIGGNVLLEGVPGLAKTLLAKTFSEVLGLNFRRIQFTPDLMPTDITGVNIFDPKSATFRFAPGPLLSDIVLADEINRTPPKTQSALLEAMEEHQITIDGERHTLSDLFFVIATQNPVEHEGTFSLPEAQLDRFLMKLEIGYPGPEVEAEMLVSLSGRNSGSDRLLGERSAKRVASREELLNARAQLRQITLAPEVAQYIISLLRETRGHAGLLLGASPRAGLALALASKLHAAWENREFVLPDDVKAMAGHVLRHRMIVRPDSGDVAGDAHQVVHDVLRRTAIPALRLAH